MTRQVYMVGPCLRIKECVMCCRARCGVSVNMMSDLWAARVFSFCGLRWDWALVLPEVPGDDGAHA